MFSASTKPSALPPHFLVYFAYEGQPYVREACITEESEARDQIIEQGPDLLAVFHVFPDTGKMIDVTERMLREIAAQSFNEYERPSQEIRDLLDARRIPYFDLDEDEIPRARSDYDEHSTLNRAQQL